MSRTWQAQRERGTIFWLRVITWFALHIGRPVAWLLQYPITAYFYATSPATRRASREFLSAVLNRPATHAESFRQHRLFACTILDRVYLLSGQEHRLEIGFHGLAAVAGRVGHGRSAMLLGAHLGSFEVLRALGTRRPELSLRVLMRPEQNRVLTGFLDQLDTGIAESVIPLGGAESMLRVKDAVDRGSLVGMLGDRAWSGEKFHECRFLGRPARFPTGPLTLASVLQVPVFLFFGIYRGGNRYDIHFELLTDVIDVPRGARAPVIAQLTERFAARLEDYARRYPYNWFNFYDFWRA